MTDDPQTRHRAEDVDGFPARELIEAMNTEGLDLQIVQTGGGTATLFLESEGSHAFLIGPGSYDWNEPLASRFSTAELYYGPDPYADDGEPVEFSDDEEKTITPGTPVESIAKEIAADFRRFNTPQ